MEYMLYIEIKFLNSEMTHRFYCFAQFQIDKTSHLSSTKKGISPVMFSIIGYIFFLEVSKSSKTGSTPNF